jgi:hypothetical protein
MLIKIGTKEAQKSLKLASKELSDDQIKRSIYLAINETMRLGRTKLRQFVRSKYNVPANLINTIDFKKAYKGKLSSEMGASFKPVQLAYFKPKFQTVDYSLSVRNSKGGLMKKESKGRKKPKIGVSIEVIKGQRKILPFAFMIKGGSLPVFARGDYRKGGGFETSTDGAINKLISLSAYSAAFSVKQMETIPTDTTKIYADKIVEYMFKVSHGIIKNKV